MEHRNDTTWQPVMLSTRPEACREPQDVTPRRRDIQNGHTGPETASTAEGVLCPYCGLHQPGSDRCCACNGLFEPLSRQATQNAMGPWQVRSGAQPFRPGCSWETLRVMVRRGRITPTTILRGPTTRQFWAFARDTPGVAVLLGICHACHERVSPGDERCGGCGAELAPMTDRQTLGLSPVQLLPGHASAAEVATSATGGGSGIRRPVSPLDPAVEARVDDTSDADRPSTVRRLRREVTRAHRTLALSIVLNVLLIAGAVWTFVELRTRFESPAVTTPTAASEGPSRAGDSGEGVEVVEAEAPEPEVPGAAARSAERPGDRTSFIPGLDPGLERFGPDFLRAMELRDQGTEESLKGAVQILSDILDEALAEAGAVAEGVTYPELQQSLADTRGELDDLVLRQIF